MPGYLKEIAKNENKTMDIKAILNEMLAQETACGIAMEFYEDELIGDAQITSVTVKEAITIPPGLQKKISILFARQSRYPLARQWIS